MASMRAARLISLVLLLQNRGSLTGPQLAQELGVSERTIARDVAELGEAGIPVYATQGRAGGYRLLEGYRTRLTGLDRAEVEALFLSGAPDALRGMGMDSAALAARLKVGAAISPSARDAPQRVRQRFHLDAPGWFQRHATPEVLPQLSAAVWGDRIIEIGYQPGRRLRSSDEREPSEVARTLRPYGLVLKAGVWYLVARGRSRTRVYRTDRIVSFHDTEERFTRDAEFDLAEFWREQSEEFARSMLGEKVLVRLSPYGWSRLEVTVERSAALAAKESVSESDTDGWYTVWLPVETLDVAYDELLRFGVDVEVLEPLSLRRRMATTASALSTMYKNALSCAEDA